MDRRQIYRALTLFDHPRSYFIRHLAKSNAAKRIRLDDAKSDRLLLIHGVVMARARSISDHVGQLYGPGDSDVFDALPLADRDV